MRVSVDQRWTVLGKSLGRALILLKGSCIKVDMFSVIAQDPNSISFKAYVDEGLEMLGDDSE